MPCRQDVLAVVILAAILSLAVGAIETMIPQAYAHGLCEFGDPKCMVQGLACAKNGHRPSFCGMTMPNE